MESHRPRDDADYFEVSGPKHMWSTDGLEAGINIDWDNEEHRRCITACLIKATCVMENDRIKCRMYNGKELAPAWWKNFGFELDEMIINDSNKHDQFTYGAIFKLKKPAPSAPDYVVAFRGTMLLHPKAIEDLLEDCWVLFNAVGDFRRFKGTHSNIDRLIRESGNVWLAGHSLGASMALEIGRNMMLKKEHNVNVPTFLFNPPHVSLAPVINGVLGEEQKTGLYIVSFAVKYGLANFLPGYRKRTKELFEKLAPWEPKLYVNPRDCICQGYIDYFVQRQKVHEDNRKIACTAARTSYRDMFFYMFSSKKLQSHLLPSARLWTNSSQNEEAHGLRQWLKSDRDLVLSSKCYSYPLYDAPA